MQVLLEDAVSVFGQFLKYVTIDVSSVNSLNTDLIYLRNPFNPYVSILMTHCDSHAGPGRQGVSAASAWQIHLFDAMDMMSTLPAAWMSAFAHVQPSPGL